MSSYVEVRGVKIGEGVPKICVPIVGKTKEEILAAAKSFADVKMDVVEWRVDWFDGVFDFAQVEDVLKDLRPALGNTPILFTFRTSKEGGEKAIEPDVYVELNKKAAATGLVDLVDVEAFTGDSYVKEIIEAAHEAGVAVVASNHDFDKTPDKDDIVGRLRKMQELDADIPKIAVMPWKEKTNVILYGEEPVKMWKALEPVPGDNIILEHPVAYVKNGVLCCRVTSPDEFQVIHHAEWSAGADTKDFIEMADDFFKRLFAENLSNEGE